MDNCIGTVNLLNYARTRGPERPKKNVDPHSRTPAFEGKFQYFSTDEVFGPAPEGVSFKEWDRNNPNNPYAAAKAAGEMAAIAFANTYRMPIFITNCMNIFGERQNGEKFIPLIISTKSSMGETLYIHANKTKRRQGNARTSMRAIFPPLPSGFCSTVNSWTVPRRRANTTSSAKKKSTISRSQNRRRICE
jgi:dTDP-glucose 4,6-dehydratase